MSQDLHGVEWNRACSAARLLSDSTYVGAQTAHRTIAFGSVAEGVATLR